MTTPAKASEQMEVASMDNVEPQDTSGAPKENGNLEIARPDTSESSTAPETSNGTETPVSSPAATAAAPSIPEAAEPAASEIDDYPAIASWNTSVLFSVLGYVLGKICLGILLILVFSIPTTFIQASIGGATDSSTISGVVQVPLAIIMLALELLYALGFYKSYFKKSPWLKSSKAISFCNLMFGGLIFGCLWNHNLTISKRTQSRMRGISYKVFATFSILARGITLLSILVFTPYSTSFYSQSSHLNSSSGSAYNSEQSGAQQSDNAVFSIDFPAKPAYKSTNENGVLTETYTAKTNDCYVLIRVDHINLDLQGEDPYGYAARITYSFLSSLINTSVAEKDIDKGSIDGHSAGYIYLDNPNDKSVVFASSILGDDYVLNLFVKANTQERLDKVVKSLTLKSPNEANNGDYVAKDAGFSIAFPRTPEYDSATGEAYGYKYTNELWSEETDSGLYDVSCITFPTDYPGLANANAINGALSSVLLSLCSSFDVPTGEANIQYDEFLGYPSAYTTFSFENYTFVGRTIMKDNKCYTVFAGTDKQDQSEAFIKSFKFV